MSQVVRNRAKLQSRFNSKGHVSTQKMLERYLIYKLKVSYIYINWVSKKKSFKQIPRNYRIATGKTFSKQKTYCRKEKWLFYHSGILNNIKYLHSFIQIMAWQESKPPLSLILVEKDFCTEEWEMLWFCLNILFKKYLAIPHSIKYC